MDKLGGTVEVSLTSAEPEKALDCLTQEGVEMFCLSYTGELDRKFSIRRQDFRRVAALAARRGDKVQLIRKSGVYWKATALLHRPILCGSFLLFLALTVLLPTRVLFFRVEGNSRIPSRKILAAAETCGIRFGAARAAVRSERIKNALLEALPDLQWAGVNTAGCVATISVRERPETLQERSREVTSIVASRDGYVLAMTVTGGNAVVHPGQTVRAGQTLISGYTDCGRYIRATQAEGEIIAQTSRSLTVLTPTQCSVRSEPISASRCYSLIFQKNRINLWKGSGIWDSSCGRIVELYPLTLPGGFTLPVALCIETTICYETHTEDLSQEQAQNSAIDFAERYLMTQMLAGKILNKSERISATGGLCRLDGSYLCEEMIGREHREEIGEIDGENS